MQAISFPPSPSRPGRAFAAARSWLVCLGVLFLGAAPMRAASYMVNTIADTVNTGNGTVSLRDAITASNLNNNGSQNTITFDPAVFGGTRRTIMLNGTPLPVVSASNGSAGHSLTITAPAVGLVLDANHASRLFQNSQPTRLTLVGMTLVNGSSSNGGAVFSDVNATLTLVNCTCRNNQADNGGAIYAGAGSFLTIRASTFAGNGIRSGLGKGGAVNFAGKQMTVQNTTFSGNTAVFAAAIYNSASSTGAPSLDSCTLAFNQAGDCGGIINDATAALALNNTLVAANTNTGGSANRSQLAGIFSGSFNLVSVGDGSSGLTNGTASNQVGTGTAPLDARLAAVADNSGPAATCALASNSPAVNAGGTTLGTDERGIPRSFGAPDIGAYEFIGSQSGPNFVVNNPADPGDGHAGASGTGDCTLRAAISAANVLNVPCTITFDPAVFGTPRQTINVTGPLPITQNLTIKAPTGGVVLACGSSVDTMFAVGAVTARFFGLTITGRGGIGVNGGSATVAGCTLIGLASSLNSVSNDSTYGQGIVFNAAGDGTAAGSLLVQNTTVVGYQSGVGIFTDAPAALRNCTVVNNFFGILPGTNTAVYNTLAASNHENFADTPSTQSGNFVGLSVADAGLDPNGLQENGGPTPTWALQSSSAAINRGDNTQLPRDVDDANGNGDTADAAPYDQRGPGYPRVQVALVDVGAYETAFGTVNGSLVVTTMADEDDGTSDPRFGTGTSLREAIRYANHLGGGIITFNLPGQASRTITLQSELPAVSVALTIVGPGADRLTLDAQGRYRIFYFTGDGPASAVSGLTLTRGGLNRGTAVYIDSGAQFAMSNCVVTNCVSSAAVLAEYYGSVTLTACYFNNCTGGGAVELDYCKVLIDSCTFSNNANSHGGDAGGAVTFVGGAAYQVINSTFVGNTAGGGAGGGVCCYASYPLIVDHCTFTGNMAFRYGAFYSLAGQQVSNTIAAGNHATDQDPDAVPGGSYNIIGGYDTAGLDPAGLRYNGGPTPTVALFRNGTAVDAGDPAFAAPPNYDQRGPGFARKVGARTDIGAFERQAFNSAPVPGAHALTRYAARGVGVSVAALVAGDYDPDGDALTITAVGAAASGRATVSLVNGYVYYEPQPGFATADSFTYQVADGFGGTATATVAVSVLAAAVPPDEQTLALTPGIGGTGGQAQLAFHLEAGRSYRVQCTDDLTRPDGWQTLGSVTADVDGRFQVVDPGPLPARRFYRAVTP